MRALALLLMALTVLILLACGGEEERSSEEERSGGEERKARTSATINAIPAAAISASDAMKHIGSRKIVCGAVKSENYAKSSRGQPTFLNLDKSFPNQIFTVIIWGSNRGNFPRGPESLCRGKNICATGLIESFRGLPQIEATSSNQIQITR